MGFVSARFDEVVLAKLENLLVFVAPAEGFVDVALHDAL